MATGSKSQTVLISIILILAVISIVLMLVVVSALPERSDESIVSTSKRLAGELADNSLPEAAIEEFSKILDYDLTDIERGSINYLIGKIYFEDIGDYEKAAAYYIRARSLDEKGSYYDEAGKNLITCLEKIGRRLDARRELDRQASLVPDSVVKPGKIVAKIGSSEITLADFNEAVQSLPPAMQDSLVSFAAKRQFLDQLIGRELIYHAALREGMDRSVQVQTDLKDLEKEYLIQHYTQLKIAPTVKPDTSEMMLYFNAHKEEYGGKEFNEVRQQVMQDYMSYVGQKAINDYIGSLLQAEPVQTFEENLK